MIHENIRQIREWGRSDLQFKNLGTAALESGLQSDELVTLQKNAAGFCSFGKLLQDRNRLATTPGYSLGIASYVDFDSAPLEAALEVLDLTHFYEAHQYFGIDMSRNNHIDAFMRCLTESGKPIVFFVPPNVYRHRGQFPHYFVADEMQWYLDKPQVRTGSTTFCFGLYDVVKPDRGPVDKHTLTRLFNEFARGESGAI
ncbi:MAG: hypothetical protein NUV52_01485 [Candidatus Roizmanbacteria bacterium]|nr:hypothetical protein [Candidatus Roizmanbacteria bacterium]